MRKQTDIDKAIKRKKVWGILGYAYKGKGLSYLSKRNSLNCGCPQCIGITKHRRAENKKIRAKNTFIIANFINDEIKYSYLEWEAIDYFKYVA